jgi:nitrogen PTS system EIIA component
MNTLEQIAATLGFPVVVLPDAAACSMESAIRFLVDRLIHQGLLHAKFADDVVRKVLLRERLGSTALGKGVALPHVVSTEVDRVLGIFADCSVAVPWESPDGWDVRTICLILSPVERPIDYLRALEQVALALRRKWE